MQDRYTGDIGDLGKFALLKALVEPNLRLGVVWYLNPDEEGNEDGGFVHYPEMRECDERLYDSLQMLVHAGMRRVAAVEQTNILPTGTAFFSEPLTFRDLPRLQISARSERREQWLEGAADTMAGVDLVFLDPDNGFACPSIAATANTGQKYVFPEDLIPYLKRDQSLVIYHHFQRTGLAYEVERNIRLLRSLGGRHVWALSFHRRSVRFFFVVAAHRHQSLLFDRSRQFLATPWGKPQRFRLHIPASDSMIGTVDEETPPLERRGSPPKLGRMVSGRNAKSTGRRWTEIGSENRNHQTVVRKTGLAGTDHSQHIYVLHCGECGYDYGANASDIFERRCPLCQAGKPGLQCDG